MDNADLIKLVQEEGIGPAEVIALRRAVCGFVVNQDGTEEKLDQTCEHLRYNPRLKIQHWCGACGCKLAWKTTLLRMGKCPKQKW